MKTAALAALPLALALAACGDPIDGSDTANMEGEATAVGDDAPSPTDYEPGADGPLQNDVVPEESEIQPTGDDDLTDSE